MYRLYTIPGSCSTGIHVLLNKLGQKVEIVNRDDVPDYAATVPTNQVPALVTDEGLLTEGAAIALFLMERHGGLPANEAELRDFRQWLLFDYATLHATYSKLFMVGVQVGELEEASRKALIRHVAERLSVLWSIVEARLDGRRYVVGDGPTVIDYLLAIYASWGAAAPEARIEIGPRTRRLIEDVSALPEFVEACEREGLEYRLSA